MTKLILNSYLLLLLPFSTYSISQTIWTCEEQYNDEGIPITICIDKKNNVQSFNLDDPDFSIATLGKNFIATIEDSGNIYGKLIAEDGRYMLELSYLNDGDLHSTIKVGVDDRLIFIGDEIESNYFNEESPYKKYIGTYILDDELPYLRDGTGLTIYHNGEVHEGLYEKDERVGIGTLQTETSKCSGTFNNDALVTGTCEYIFGEKYSGDFLDGYASGYGELYFEDGAFYKGFFLKDKYHGKGKYTYSNGTFYEGAYRNGLPNGYGFETFKGLEFASFSGFYIDGKKHQGSYLRSDGEPFYIGVWPSGQETGSGSRFLRDDTENNNLTGIITGTFNSDLLCTGFCRFELNDIIYEGEFEKGFPSGIIKEFSSGDIFTGTMDEDFTFNGEVIWQSLDPKFTWEGPFINGWANGEGVVTFVNDDGSENKYYATFKDGKYIGGDELFEAKSIRSNKRIALVIGNDNYVSNPLQFAVKDSYGIASLLKRSGFEVIHIEDATQEQFFNALYDLRNKIKLYGPRTDVLFYYAGHAAQVDGINYLNPIDTLVTKENQLETRSINMNRVFEVLNESIDGVKIAILDACRNNPFSSSIRSMKPGLAQMLAPKGTIIAFSTGPGETAVDGSYGDYGVYTGSLIKSIQKEDLTIEEVFKETRKIVVSETQGQQVPWESSSLISDFYFIRKD